MVRYAVSRWIQNFPEDEKVLYIEGYCDSDDTKPTEQIAQGSLMTEVDTGKIFMFDESAGDWSLFVSVSGE